MRVSTAAALTVAAVGGLGFASVGSPCVEPAEGLGTLLQGAKMPEDAKAVLVTKCADCFSSEPRWPVYAWIAPDSWPIERNIVEARKKMDSSQWEKLSQEAKSGDMPPPQYRLLHWLSKADVQTISMLGKSAGSSAATLRGAGDPARGKAVFEKRCTGCHAMEADLEGPRLAGVFGRKAGGVPR